MINAITDATAPQPTAGLNGLDKDTFLKLLVAQMRYQNPMSPMDGQEYLAQAAQFAAVERLEEVSKAQAEAVAYQQILLSSSLVGRTVRATDGDQPIEGTVSAVRFQGGTPMLVVNDREIPVGTVEEVKAPAGSQQ